MKPALAITGARTQNATNSPGSRCRAIAQAVVRPGNRYERTVQKLSRHPRARLARRANRELAQEHGGHRFRRTSAIPIGTQVIVIPYSFAMKLRPLRRACLASASVNLGASGSESPMAPRKARNALETFPAAIISSKTGAAPRPAPSSVTAGSCRIAREIMAGFARRSSRATNVPALCASTFAGAPICSITTCRSAAWAARS